MRLTQQNGNGSPPPRHFPSPGTPKETLMQVKSVAMVVLGVAAAVVCTACSYPPPSGDYTGIFEAAVRRIQADHDGAVRFDPRVMDSIPLEWDYERDTLIAPNPTLLSLPWEERDREAVLARLGAQRERIEDYTACTLYLSGRPLRQPEATAESMPAWTAVVDSARRACSERERYGAVILGLPRRVEDGSPWKIADGTAWRIRAYLVEAKPRFVFDLVVSQVDGKWTVIDSELRLSYMLDLTSGGAP
jgi:hypothetical protein